MQKGVNLLFISLVLVVSVEIKSLILRRPKNIYTLYVYILFFCIVSISMQMWEFLTNGPVFSSPCVTPDLQQVLCGSHDGSLYCLNCADGSLAWSFRTTGKVFSSPCVFDGSALGRWGTLVGLASTDGTVWVLDGRDGRLLASSTLTGELFSSPVVWGRSLVLGCRNDFVYCLNLTVKDELPEG